MGPTSRRWRAALQLISTQRATGDAEELVGERDQVVQHPGPGVLLVQVVVRRLLVCDFRLRGSLGARRSRRRRPCSSHCEMPTCRVDGAAIIERFLQPRKRRQRPTGLRARARVRREEPAQSGRRRATMQHLTSRLLAREPRTEHSHVSIRLHSAPYPSRAARANATMTARVCNILSQPNSWLPCTAHEYVPHATSARRPPPTGC